MKYKYGEFDDRGNFIIKNPNTPLPWINYLTNGNYCALISQHGGGFSFYVDPARHFTLRRESAGLRRDCPGRFFYLVDEERGTVWSPNRVPMNSSLENFQAIHQPGLTRIEAEYQGIKTEIEYFVPPDEDQEIWSLKIINQGSEQRRLRVVAVGEWLMGNSARDATDRQWDQLFKVVRYIEKDHLLLGHKRHWETKTGVPREVLQWPYHMYMTATQKPRSWETRHSEFFGPYRDYHNPQALEQEQLGCHEVEGSEAIGAMDWTVTLPAGGEQDLSCMVGVVETTELEQVDWSDYRSNSYVEQARAKTLDYWQERFSPVQVELPDRDLQNLVNRWLPYQVTVNTWFGRAPSFWHSSQGYTGYRDGCHETYGCTPFAAPEGREKLLHILSFNFKNGLNSHRTPRGARDFDESNNADDPLWVPLAVEAYLKQTGDWQFLEEQVPYLDSQESGTVLEHMLAGIDYVLTQRGERGLPLIRYGDWNDALNTLGDEGTGESVWIGQFLCLALQKTVEILDQYGYKDKDRIEAYRSEAEQIKNTINRDCWDGKWYLRAFTDEGEPVGSAKNSAGQLFLNTQTWGVLSGVADRDRAELSFAAVHQLLDSSCGLRYFAPAYDKIDPEIGVITQFYPGKKENGSIFSHAAAFALVALAELGWRKEAYQLWKKISPTTRAADDADLYRLEPYVYCQNITGPDSDDFGQGNYHWLSGTASWVYRAVLDHILGVRADWDGLKISPALPPDWDYVKVNRKLRGVEWMVEIFQKPGGDGEISKLVVDQKEFDGDLIPFPETGDAIHVEVYVS